MFKPNAYGESHHPDCTRFEARFPWDCNCQDLARNGKPMPPRLDICPRDGSADTEIGPGDTAICNVCGVRW